MELKNLKSNKKMKKKNHLSKGQKEDLLTTVYGAKKF